MLSLLDTTEAEEEDDITVTIKKEETLSSE